MFDGHIHIDNPEADRGHFARSLHAAGFEGALLISPAPASFPNSVKPSDWRNHLECLEKWSMISDKLFPFFWIDPLEDDAEKQVESASETAVGFKVICNRFYPSDERALKIYRQIAALGKPILFHSGILYDGLDSARYNRPGEFECLLEVPNLKFALAHISWPWCDECIAVYGKFQNAYSIRPDVSSEMFIDLTPGTPTIYRRDALTKIFTVGYNVADNVIFGSDGCVGSYGSDWVKQWVSRDTDIYDSIDLVQETRDKVFGKNLLRFVGK